MNLPVALQLYSLREETKKDFIGTLEKVAEIGYKGVEFAGFGDIPADRMKDCLDSLGLKAVGSHTSLDLLKNSFDKIVEYNHKIGNSNIICPYNEYKSRQDYIEAAKLYNKIGEKCKEKGFEFHYHNHAHEFEIFDGEYGLDIIFKETSSKLVKAEIDTCFVKVAGLDPAAYIKKYKGRCPLLHLKDVEEGGTNGTVEIGNGILDFKGIIDAAMYADVKWLIVEQEFFKGSSLESIKICYENIKKVLDRLEQQAQQLHEQLKHMSEQYRSLG